MMISGRYEVIGLLGQGGMGVVYQVRDTTRGRESALKTLVPGRSEDIIERFLVEANVMFRLEHPNIVRVFDFGKDADTYFLTMEMIRGRNLRQLLNARMNKGFPLRDVVRMGIEIAGALDYAHTQKPEAVVHRDIKPVNIMIEDDTGRVIVTDFGIAKLMANTGETSATDLSRTVFAGTVPYSAPEQFRPIGPTRRLDARVDIYALGMVLYEIYTGRHFFAGLSGEEVEIHHRSLDEGKCVVTSPHACEHKVVLPDVPAAFASLIEKAIAHERDDRFRSAADMLAALQQYALAESLQNCEVARLAAESAGAPDAAASEYRRGSDLAQSAKDAQQRGEYGKVAELLQSAEQAFSAATAQVDEQRAKRAIEGAKAAWQQMADKATERDLAAVAPDVVQQAAELVAAAEASAARGESEQAVQEYQQAEEVFRAALVRTHPEGQRHAIEEELPALHAAREGAERAGATTLAADAFNAAVGDQQELEAALESAEMTRARELLPKVRTGFTAATAAAVQAKARRGTNAARAAMERARAALLETGAEQLVPEELAEAQALELEGGATEKREHLRRAEMLYRAASRVYEDVRAKALRYAEERKLADAGAAARMVMEAARTRAESAGAATAAAERYAAAAALAKRAAEAANDAAGMAAAAADFALAAEGFDAAFADAERALRRSELERILATVEETRQQAIEAGAEGHGEFAAAAEELAAARRALDADDLSLVASAAATARERFVAATMAGQRVLAEKAADAVLAKVAHLCAEVGEAGAEELAPTAWAKAVEHHERVLARRRDGDVEAVPRLAAKAERAFTVALGATAEGAKERAVAARATAQLAGADDDATAAAADAFRAGEERCGADEFRAAVLAFRQAAAGYEAATEACGTAARQGEAATTDTESDAAAAEAVELAADVYSAAVTEREAAAAALEIGRFTEATNGFRIAVQGFRAAAETAVRERGRRDALRTEEIRKAVDAGSTAFRAAFLAGDGEKVAELYTSDAEIVRVDTPIVSGRPAIAAFWKAASGGVTKLTIETRTLESSGNLAVAAGSIEIRNADGAPSTSRYVAVWKREAGSWKLHRDVWTAEPASSRGSSRKPR